MPLFGATGCSSRVVAGTGSPTRIGCRRRCKIRCRFARIVGVGASPLSAISRTSSSVILCVTVLFCDCATCMTLERQFSAVRATEAPDEVPEDDSALEPPCSAVHLLYRYSVTLYLIYHSGEVLTFWRRWFQVVLFPAVFHHCQLQF